MNKTNVGIHVFPSETDPATFDSYDPTRDGRVFSSTGELKVNTAAYGYSILFKSEDFEELKPAQFTASMIQLFSANIKDTIIDVSIFYHYDEEDFDTDTAIAVLDMDDVMRKITESGRVKTFVYTRSDNIVSVYNDWRSESEEAEEDNEGEDEDESGDFFDFLNGFSDDEQDDEDEDDDKPRHDDYHSSWVLKESKNPKKSIRRHGVIVASSKSDIKRDEKIIKSFLKEFIPGNAEWKREFRSDVAKRWMKMYAISRKRLKKLEKDHRRSKARKNKVGIDTDKALDFTRRLFTMPVDRWSDPTK